MKKPDIAAPIIVKKRVKVRGKYVYSHLYKCACGNEFIAEASSVTSGHTRSCGCYQRLVMIAKGHKHGYHDTPTYASWENMVQRCTNKNCPNWEYYGGRGITVYKPWLESFENFLADMGERPLDTSIDRINNDGNYEPDNCRWASKSIQTKNRRPRSCYKKSKAS